MSAYNRLRRSPMFRRNGSSRPEDITNSPDRVKHRPVLIHFAAQTVHKDVHDIGLRVEAVVEDVFEDHGLGDRAIGIAHEVFEQGELARLQLDLLAPALHVAGEQIQGQVTDDEAGGLGGLGRAANERLDARQQLGEGEGTTAQSPYWFWPRIVQLPDRLRGPSVPPNRPSGRYG